jgi:hypothetical protein
MMKVIINHHIFLSSLDPLKYIYFHLCILKNIIGLVYNNKDEYYSFNERTLYGFANNEAFLVCYSLQFLLFNEEVQHEG